MFLSLYNKHTIDRLKKVLYIHIYIMTKFMNNSKHLLSPAFSVVIIFILHTTHSFRGASINIAFLHPGGRAIGSIFCCQMFILCLASHAKLFDLHDIR